MKKASQYHYWREKYILSRIDHSQESETKHWFSPDSFVNLADVKYSIVYACLFSIYRAEVEIVARVYRAIFDPFLHCRFTIRCIPLLPPHPSFLSFLSSSQQPAATLLSVTLHYLPLRNVEDASFRSGARKISSAVSSVPAALGS